jgi:mono/diheme cytochrome c family protein
MPGSTETLSDQEIWAIIAFLKNHWSADMQAENAT